MTSYTQPNIINLVPESSILYEPGQFASQYIGTWKANSSTGNTPSAIKKKLVPMATHFFPVPTHFIILEIFSSKNITEAPNLI